MFEPHAPNVERLRENLRAYADRADLYPVAVNVASGPVPITREESGRYGGIGQGDTEHTVMADGLHVNECLDRVFEHEDLIDFLKVDIEKMEREIIEAIAPHHRARIRKIVIELREGTITLDGFETVRAGHIITLRNTRL